MICIDSSTSACMQNVNVIEKNQSGNLDDAIDDVLEHFVYVPRKSTANAQDIPVFLSSRIASMSNENKEVSATQSQMKDPVSYLRAYETSASDLSLKFDKSFKRFA